MEYKYSRFLKDTPQTLDLRLHRHPDRLTLLCCGPAVHFSPGPRLVARSASHARRLDLEDSVAPRQRPVEHTETPDNRPKSVVSDPKFVLDDLFYSRHA